MSLFCLVHGAYEGAWCWNLLIPELEARGHQAIALDLPLEDPNAGAVRYAEAVLQVLHDAGDDIVLVGHSMSGLLIPLVANQHPVRQLVYLAALIPKIGTSLVDRALHGDESDMHYPALLEKNFSLDAVDETAAMEFLFHDCKPDVASWAISKLRPHASRLMMNEISPIQIMPNIKSSYIVCMEDRILTQAWSKRAARELLGVDAIAIPGGHCPQLSRPVHLADVLTELLE